MMVHDTLAHFRDCISSPPSSRSSRDGLIYNSSASVSPTSSPYGSSTNLAEMFGPKSPRMVTTCKNCAYSYRITASKGAGFCSKGKPLFHCLSYALTLWWPSDCETCFTVFYSMGSPSPVKQRTLAEIRESIYHFQQTRHDEDEQRDQDAADKESAQGKPRVTCVTAPRPLRPTAQGCF